MAVTLSCAPPHPTTTTEPENIASTLATAAQGSAPPLARGHATLPHQSPVHAALRLRRDRQELPRAAALDYDLCNTPASTRHRTPPWLAAGLRRRTPYTTPTLDSSPGEHHPDLSLF